MNNLFGDLGIFSGIMPVMDEKESKKKESSSKPSKKVPEEKYKAPLKLLFDSMTTIVIEEDKEYAKTDLFREIDKIKNCELFGKSKTEFVISKVKEGIYHIRPAIKTKYSKGSSGKKLLIQDLKDVQILSKENEELSAEIITQRIKELYKMDVELYLVGETYIPVPVIKDKKLDKLKFPVKATALTMQGQVLEFTKEDYNEFEDSIQEQGSLLPDDLKMEFKVNEKTIVKMLSNLFPDYSANLVFGYDEREETLQVMHKGNEQTTAPLKETPKKEDTYPTNATLSLIFTKYNLTPDLFQGKKEVTKKELLTYIRKLGYVEYSPERTEIQYEKKENMIIPLIKSAKRGYSLEDSMEYRKEDTELMSICVSKNKYQREGEYLIYHLPKVPFQILKEVIYFFWDVYVYHGTEAAVQLFYNKVEEEYEIYIPKQEVTSAHVTFERDTRRETDPNLILAVEMHSHGRYEAFWSGEDDKDEVAHRIYAVIGGFKDFKYDRQHIKVRGASGGYHVVVSPEKIFEFPKSVKEFHGAIGQLTFN